MFLFGFSPEAIAKVQLLEITSKFILKKMRKNVEIIF